MRSRSHRISEPRRPAGKAGSTPKPSRSAKPRTSSFAPDANLGSLSQLKPAFVDPEMAQRYPHLDWRVTAGNSSPLSDGASAVMITSEHAVHRLGLPVLARLREFVGHPLGASGVRVTANLVNALRQRGLRCGLQTMCEGGGMANALVLEAL
jgi:acetyl-CoA acetyltransferase